MALNWNLEVFITLLAFLFFLTFCLILVWYSYSRKTKLFLFTIITFAILGSYDLFEAVAYLFLSHEMKRIGSITISIGFLFLVLNVDLISKERISYYKLVIASLLIGATFVFVLIPENISSYNHPYLGYPTLAMTGPLLIIYILTLCILIFQLLFWIFKTWYKAPPELKKDALILFLAILVFFICVLIMYSFGLWLIFPIGYLLVILIITIATIVISHEPKLLHILSFTGQRITVITHQSGIPLFDLSWETKKGKILTEQQTITKWIPVLQQLSKEISTTSDLEELKLKDSTILFKHTKLITTVLLSQKSSPILRTSLMNFTKAFENRYNKLLRTGMTDSNYFQEADELINEIFPLGTISAIKTSKNLESYLEDLVTQRTSELKQLNIQLQKADHSKSLFLASMSHELRNPLTSILGYAEILKHGHSGDLTEKQLQQLNSIYNSGYYLLNIIDGILDISKIEAGKFNLNLEEFDFNDLVNEIIEALLPKAMRKSILLKRDLLDNIILFSDKDRIKQILFNLLDNAVKFTPIGGEIIIKTEIVNQNKLTVHIIDNGIGITQESLNKLFRPFHQADMSISKGYGGTGLGLYLTKKLVNLLGGDISVHSKINKGSDFNFTIPIRLNAAKIKEG